MKPLPEICLLLFLVPGLASGANLTRQCDEGDPQREALSCHGVRIIRRVVDKLLAQMAARRKIAIAKGVDLVAREGARAAGAGSVLEFLRGREVRVALPELLPDFEGVLNRTLRDVSEGEDTFFRQLESLFSIETLEMFLKIF